MENANAIEQIYNKLATVFGGTNANQVFTMMMPGTTLNASSFSYDTTKRKPATVIEAESRLVDQMFDIAKVSGSSNGQRVSSQYLQSLSVLVPKFNPLMPDMKSILRNFISTPVPENTFLDEKPFVGSLAEYYFKLYEGWIDAKEKWEQKIVETKNELSKNPDTENDLFLEWYEQVAEGELAKIDEAMGKVLSVFSPSDMDAILGALASGPGGEIDEAANMVKDIRLASPKGGYFYPVDMQPDDWFLDLASDIDPVDLLKDPEFIAATITAKRRALQASLSQIQALIDQLPPADAVKKASDALSKAQIQYTQAQNSLLTNFSDNILTAVQIVLAKAYPAEAALGAVEKGLTEAAEVTQKVNDTAVSNKKVKPLGNEDLNTILNGYKSLIEAQSDLLTSSQSVAGAGLELGSAQAADYKGLPVLLARVQDQLADIQTMEKQLIIKASAPSNPPVLGVICDDATISAANNFIKSNEFTLPTTAADVRTAVNTYVNSKTGDENTALQVLVKACADTTPVDKVKSAVKSAVSELPDDISPGTTKTDAKNFIMSDDFAKTPTTAAAVRAAVSKFVNKQDPEKTAFQALVTACADTPVDEVRSAVIQVINTQLIPKSGKAKAQKSDASARFMDLQFSFSSSSMKKDSAADTSFSQMNWSVDLFFGSASGSYGGSSAVSSEHAFEANTEIQIGLKAAKVDIERGWFDPGVFKLSEDMSRLSTEPVSMGSFPVNNNGELSWPSDLKNWNKALLPSFPVAFVVVKDVTITFQLATGQTDAFKSVMDSRSASGGGFLCFSASSSSASHSDHSSLSSTSTGNTVTIHMPGPQILGWFLETVPKDGSTQLKVQDLSTIKPNDIDELTIISFVNKMSSLTTKKEPSKPIPAT